MDDEEATHVDHAMERAEDGIRESLETDNHIAQRRARVWKMRIMGYSVAEIAEELKCAFGTAHGDIKWCLKNYPPAYESADELRHVSLERLDAQYRRVLSPRPRYDEQANVVGYDPPMERGELIAQRALDMMHKLLGAYAPTRVETGVTQREPSPALLGKIEAARAEVKRRAAELQAQAARGDGEGGADARRSAEGSSTTAPSTGSIADN